MSNRTFVPKPDTDVLPPVIEPPRHAGSPGVKQILSLGSLALILLGTGCASETLFKSNLDTNPSDQPPTHTQEIGTVNVDGLEGSVLVVPPPVTPSGKWVRIRRPDDPVHLAALQANLSQFRGAGTYVFSSFMFIPSGSGLATIQFEPFGQAVTNYAGFLHLDFMQDNRVRIDDDDTTAFGTFPRDSVFVVEVTLNINASSPSAHIVLSGAGASGQADRTVAPPFRAMAQQFGAVRLWMGTPWTGSFDATTIVVTKKP